MAAKDDIREFLTTRRAKITPDQAGLPVYGANRRVTGLREEVALLAGISVEYYTRLERGSVGSVSDAVLDGLVHALQLDEAERDHLFRRPTDTRHAGNHRSAPAAGRARPSPRRHPITQLVPLIGSCVHLSAAPVDVGRARSG